MPKFRKKPVVIDAMQFDGSRTWEVFEFMGTEVEVELFSESAYIAKMGPPLFCLLIPTNEGVMKAYPNDWIIKEPFPVNDRKFYPCKPEIFNNTYTLIEDQDEE